MEKRIKINAEKAISKTYESIKVGEYIEIPIIIDIENIQSCELTTLFDINYLELIKGKEKLKLQGGTYQKEIVFILKTLKPTLKEGTWISFEAKADNLPQRATLPIKIIE